MKSKILSFFLVASLLVGCGTAKSNTDDIAINNPIETFIYLDKVANDKAPVTINPGRFTTETVTYRLPKVVQGTYAVSNFGKYIDDFKALDYQGKELQVTKDDTNTWTINNAKSLDKITYWVNDTYDMEIEGGIGKDVPFSPSGTNIEPNVYVLNLFGFIGYFDSLKNNQYKLAVSAPANFVHTAALKSNGTTTSADGKYITNNYVAERYFDITDNPMMYGDLDVEEFQVGDIKIVLSVYSPNKLHSAKSLKDTFYKMMQAQKSYLGDINSTARYDIYVYLADGENTAKGFGALEHHTSTVVVMPESYPADLLANSMIDIVSHEFFHIVTPLSVHSEDVHYFDYGNPTFSKHLWMYEGVTEYFSTLFQINKGLVDEDEFYNTIMDKIQMSRQMNDAMSFTIMSENVLKAPYKDQYYNVYQKGALIGMCIDILMRSESNGERGILSLMKELSNKYGKDKPFEDDKLIDEIVAMTYPSLQDFFDTHVIGDIPIDYNEFFDKVGLKIGDGKVETNYILMDGRPIVDGDAQTGTIFFSDAVTENSFWVENGAKSGDIIKSIGGEELTMTNANQLLQQVFSWKPGDDIHVVLVRDGQEIEIKTKATKTYTTGSKIVSKENATDKEKAIREAWLRG